MSVAFLMTSLVIVATPGTGALFTISAGLRRGRRAGVIAAAGCTIGIVPHLAAAITGTAVLLHTGGVAFEVVKILGAAYLLYMAWATWQDRTALVLDHDDREQNGPSALRMVSSAVLVNLLNPKLTLFFFAFLPQFVPATGPQMPVMLGLSGVFMAMTFVVFAGYGVFAASMRHHLIDRPRLVRRIRQTFAASFLALSAKLALMNQ